MTLGATDENTNSVAAARKSGMEYVSGQSTYLSHPPVSILPDRITSLGHVGSTFGK